MEQEKAQQRPNAVGQIQQQIANQTTAGTLPQGTNESDLEIERQAQQSETVLDKLEN